MSFYPKHEEARTAVYGLCILAFSFLVSWGCASGPKVTPEQKAAQNSAEKARQDSLRRFEAMKNWSLGHENFKNKDYNRVIPYFLQVLKLDSEHRFRDLYSELARTYFQLGKIDSAEVIYKMGAEVFPENAHLHQSLAYIYENRGDAESAITEYERVVQLEPESLSDWRRLGALYAKADRKADAIKAYEKIIELDPNDGEARNALTAFLRATGNEQAALDNMERALEADPNNDQLLYDLARQYRMSENFDKAIEKYKKLISLKPNEVVFHQDLASIYKRLERFNNVISEDEAILKIQADNKQAIAEIADAYLHIGDLRRARDYADRVLRLDRNFGAAYIIRGQVLEKAVDQCRKDMGRDGKEFTFDDKLIYQMANEEYKKALGDISVKQNALAHMRSVEPVVPKQEDFFMHKGQTKPKLECYQWLLR